MYITKSIGLKTYCDKHNIFPKKVTFEKRMDPVTLKEKVWKTWFYEVTDDFVEALNIYENNKREFFAQKLAQEK